MDAAYLEAYDETLAKAGARVYARRRALMAELAPRAQATFASIGRTPEPAAYGYHPAHLGDVDFAMADEAALAVALREALVVRSRRDLDRGFTSVGPHVDDVTVTLGGRSARAYASQGQQRALVLGWKIAEIENLEASMGFLPLLLLDDVSSELDPERNAYLMDYLAASGAQVFLTTTDASLVRGAAAEDSLWLGVRAGEVTSLPPSVPAPPAPPAPRGQERGGDEAQDDDRPQVQPDEPERRVAEAHEQYGQADGPDQGGPARERMGDEP